MDFPGRLIAGFLVVILIIIFPLQYIASLNNESIDALVDDRTHQFSNSIREKGFIDKQMYEEYVSFLDATGERYEIDLQDIRPIKGEDVSSVKENSITGVTTLDNNIMPSFMSTNEIQSFATHTHKEDCYAGHNHAISGCTDGYVCHDGSLVISSWHGYTADSEYRFNCSTCDKEIIRFTVDYYSNNTNYFIYTLRWNSYMNDYYLTASNYFIDSDYGDKGYPIVYNIFYMILGGTLPRNAKTLYKNYPAFNFVGTYGDSSWISLVPPPICQIENDNNPICDRVVTSITPTNPSQTVKKGETIITTATATYLDGHTEVVNCTSNYDPNVVGNQIVTLTYTGLVGNAKATGTRTCTIRVMVLPARNLMSITALPEYQTKQRYSMPSFTVRANYDDGTSKVLSSSEYSMLGFNGTNIGLQSVVVIYTEGGVTKSATVNVKVTALMKGCPRCNQTYEFNPDDTDPGCPYCSELIVGIEVTPNYVEVTQGNVLPITVMGIYNDGIKREVTGWISNFDSERIGLQIVTVQYQGYAADITAWVNEGLTKCPVCDTEYPETEEVCPVCSKKVVRIEASPKEVTIMQFEPIPLTVTAYYADGSSGIVDDWAIDRTSVALGTFIATVSYKGVSDTIRLTVLSINSIECPICHTIYNLSENPKGCPLCSEEIIGIEAYLTSGTNLVQLGTTPAIAVILIFRDEHREFAGDSYELENYNSRELGIQTVRVLYKSFATTIIIEVVNRLDAITCPNGHVYYKNSDGTDPECPFCHEAGDISQIAYFDITYTTELLDTLYSMGVYHIQEGNYISVIVTKRDKSLIYRLQNIFFSTSMLGKKKRFIYGGEVKNE